MSHITHQFILTSKISACRSVLSGSSSSRTTIDVSAALARLVVCLESEGINPAADPGGVYVGGLEPIHVHLGEMLFFWHNAAEADGAADLVTSHFWINGWQLRVFPPCNNVKKHLETQHASGKKNSDQHQRLSGSDCGR